MVGHARRNWAGYCLLLLLAAGLMARVAYALPGLDTGRFWDERFSLRNVRSLVAEGQVRPQNGYYPALSYLPHSALIAAAEGLHRLTGIESLSMLDPQRSFGFSRSAIFVTRLVSVIAGTLTIGLVYLLGRRLASPAVGLLAAGILSASWTHLFVSVKFKPDVLTVLAFVVAFWWILNALERPTAARFALAGLGVGLAASTKYLGASIAIPLVASALFAAGKELRTWGRLALAGAVAVGSFVTLNPWLSLIVHDMSVTKRDYAAKAAAAGETHWTVLAEEVAWLTDDHRSVVALFVFLGCAGLVARAAGWLRGGLPRPAAIAILAAILGHSVFYAGATRHFEPWNYLPVLPFTSFAAAWAIAGLAQWLVTSLPETTRAPVRAILGVVAAVLVLAFPFSVTYAATIPTTSELALEALDRLEPSSARIVYAEDIRTEVERDTIRHEFLLLEVENLAEVPRTSLERADALVFSIDQAQGPRGDVFARWLDSEGRSANRIEARWFRGRGPGLVVVDNGWELRGDVLHWTIEGREQPPRLPLAEPLELGEIVSLAVHVWRGRGRQFPGAVRIEGAGETPLYQLQAGRQAWMVTPKIRLERAVDELSIRFSGLAEEVLPFEVKLYRWRRAGCLGTSSTTVHRCRPSVASGSQRSRTRDFRRTSRRRARGRDGRQGCTAL